MAIADYYDDIQDEVKPVTAENEKTDVFDDPEQLARLLDRSPETAEKVLRLLDGLEAFAEPPTFDEPNLLLPVPSIEGFQETLSDIWERIKRWLEAVRKWLMDDSRHAHLSLQTIKLQAENLKIEGRSKLVQPRSGMLTLRGRIPSISVFYKPPRDVGTLISNVRFMDSAMAAYLGYVDNHLLGKVGRISGRVMQLDPQVMSSASLSELQDEVMAASPKALLGPMRFTDLPGQTHRMNSPHLTGNLRLIYSQTSQEPTLYGVASQSVRMTHSEIHPRRMPQEIQFPRFGRVQHEQATGYVIALAERLMQHTAGPMRKRRERSLNDISQAVERFSQDVQRLSDGEIQRKEQVRQVVQLARTITDWMNNPYHGMIANTARTLRGTLMVCRANLSQ